MSLVAMHAADLHASIALPLARVGFAADEPALLSRIVRDVVGQPACLPLLQFTCLALWDRRDPVQRLVLTREYDAMGGASGALGSIAEHFLSLLSSEQIQLVRRTLLELVSPDGTRRPRLRQELVDVVGSGAEVVIHLLLERRLIVASREVDGEHTRIDLAHEALAATWPQLTRWLDETYEQRLLIAEIDQAAKLWRKRGEREDETWTGAALSEAVRRLAQWAVTLPSHSRQFLDAGMLRAHRRARRRRWLIGLIASGLLVVTVAAVLVAVAFAHKESETREQQASLVRAAADMGRFILQLEPYDWDPEHQRVMSPAQPTRMSWQLRKVDRADPRSPGVPYPETDVSYGMPWTKDGTTSQIVEARSGAAFFEIDRGAECAPSILFVQRLPGFTERDHELRTIHIRVPTCRASRSTQVAIPAGSFFRDVNREDGTPPFDEPAYLPTYAIDRTEVTRGAFSLYMALETWTGDSAAPADYLDLERSGGEYLPMVGINFYVARAYCRFMGKDLPTRDEWQKAFRGGTEIGGVANPDPHRVTPWLHASAARPANLKPESSHGLPAAVGAYPDDVSPYGVLDLSGNVAEWSSSPSNDKKLRSVLGGSWNVPADLYAERIEWRNARPDMNEDYETGVRCVVRR